MCYSTFSFIFGVKRTGLNPALFLSKIYIIKNPIYPQNKKTKRMFFEGLKNREPA